MGKVRIKTFGDEEVEKKDAKKAEARAEAKKAKEAAAERQKAAEAAATPETKSEVKETAPKEEAPVEKKEAKKPMVIKQKVNKIKHSEKYLASAKEVDRTKRYALNDALALLEKVKYTKFDETVELHINTIERGVSGSVTLPHGTGKETKVVIANLTADAAAVDALIAEIEAGQINFDVLIATPETMPKLAKIARVLGPRGLMPNPKNGTVTPKPDEIAKKFAGGQINFKTEAKFPLLHLAVGKLSFGEKKLSDNIKEALKAIQVKRVKSVTLKSTMSPGIKLDSASL